MNNVVLAGQVNVILEIKKILKPHMLFLHASSGVYSASRVDNSRTVCISQHSISFWGAPRLVVNVTSAHLVVIIFTDRTSWKLKQFDEYKMDWLLGIGVVVVVAVVSASVVVAVVVVTVEVFYLLVWVYLKYLTIHENRKLRKNSTLTFSSKTYLRLAE